jgi:hypothetical protein
MLLSLSLYYSTKNEKSKAKECEIHEEYFIEECILLSLLFYQK